jgi:hypothetical protein
MKSGLTCAAACALFIISTTSIAAPILSSPTYYVAPGGNTASQSGPGPQSQETVWTYGGFDNAAYANLYYAFGDAGPIGVFDTFLTDGPSIDTFTTTEAKNPLSYNAGLSNLAGGLVVWSGNTTIPSSSYSLNTRWSMGITDVSNTPLSLTDPGSLGLDPSLGGVLSVTGDFKVTLNALIQNPDVSFNYNDGSGTVTCNTGDWCHAYPVWDALGATFSNSSDKISASYDWAYYYDPVAVPVPAAAWLFGSGLLGIIGIARRKQAA